MRHRIASNVFLVGWILLLLNGNAAAQGNSGNAGNPNKPLDGSGTPGTVPLWTDSGKVLTDSHIHDNGSAVTINAPSQTFSNDRTPAISGFNNEQTTGGTGVYGVGHGPISTGVLGEAYHNGVYGIGQKVGVAGSVPSAEPCDPGTCTGLFSAGVLGQAHHVSAYGGHFGNDATGGTALRGFASGSNGVGVDAFAFGGGVAGAFYTFGQGDIIHGVGNCVGASCAGFFSIAGDGSLFITGNATKPGGGAWSVASDARLKHSVEPIGNALHKLLQLRGVTYEYTDPAAIHELSGTHLGMVAQDVEPVFPSWVDTGTDGYKRLTFRGFEAVAVEAIRELDAQTRDAAARVEDLERQNAELRNALETLSEAVRTLRQR